MCVGGAGEHGKGEVVTEGVMVGGVSEVPEGTEKCEKVVLGESTEGGTVVVLSEDAAIELKDGDVNKYPVVLLAKKQCY